MKKILCIIFVLSLVPFVVSAKKNSDGTVSVNGYFRSNGTYVQPYVRTAPDSYKWNNFRSYEYGGYKTMPYLRDYDKDGISNYLDMDDNNNKIIDDLEKLLSF